MDYIKIGQNIRKFRKAHGLSQEELAEKVNISTTHMSHIETGSTKLSLPVLCDLSKALQVSTDDIIAQENFVNTNASVGELMKVIETCTPQQIKVITDTAKSLKLSLEKYT